MDEWVKIPLLPPPPSGRWEEDTGKREEREGHGEAKRGGLDGFLSCGPREGGDGMEKRKKEKGKRKKGGRWKEWDLGNGCVSERASERVDGAAIVYQRSQSGEPREMKRVCGLSKTDHEEFNWKEGENRGKIWALRSSRPYPLGGPKKGWTVGLSCVSAWGGSGAVSFSSIFFSSLGFGSLGLGNDVRLRPWECSNACLGLGNSGGDCRCGATQEMPMSRSCHFHRLR